MPLKSFTINQRVLPSYYRNFNMNVNTNNLFAHTTLHERSPSAQDSSDMNWFSATMASPPPNETKPMATSLAQSSNYINSLSSKASSDLKRLSKSSDPMDIMIMTRSASSLATEVSLAAKIVNKSVQAVEKLTNLS